MNDHNFFASAPQGLLELLADELRALGATAIRLQPAGVYFRGPLALGYRACLWSRLAGRVLLEIAVGPARDADELYTTVQRVDWRQHIPTRGTLAVEFTGANPAIVHTRYGAQRVKDAIVDQFNARGGIRPDVDVRRPDVRVSVHLRKPSGHGIKGMFQETSHDEAVISIDLAGEGLHRRGWREDGVEAPIKENLAAGVLLRAGWPALAAAGAPLVDPMCGSGTLLIEAAHIACDRAPGLSREYFGFQAWRGHQPAIWSELMTEARARAAIGISKVPPIFGFDGDPAAVKAAIANAARAGLGGRIRVERRELAELVAPETGPSGHDRECMGLVATNPPYGERLGVRADMPALYELLGERLRAQFGGWKAAVLAPDLELGRAIGLRAERRHVLYNGAIPVNLLRFEIPREAPPPRAYVRSEGGEALFNRLRKNRKQLGSWAARNGIEAYRVYDSDIPEYAVAVDVYRDWALVQEYAAPAEIDPVRAAARLREALRVIPDALEIPAGQVVCKRRERAKGGGQYGRRDDAGDLLEVREGPGRFLVNLTDYLDTGLFLDHRETRALVGKLARGQRFLNLFAYTGTASVYAGKGGALSTTTVDMSSTYCAWARRNLELNGLRGPQHRVVEAECREFMARELRRYGLIFLDPPTFSNSKKMAGVFDVQRDHVELIRAAVRLLERGGVLIFSTNYRRFRLDEERLADLEIEELSATTIPKDFARSPKIHKVWRIEAGR
ncbi:bifunctional 23S rRNA (guanine(2069)-N(7))-methyltransferase RlmK/23S rRNA (guanine(2445)-N(2))-methyltransferase RlmL [Nannocystis pusilla]|uniref:Ribosomal RNA large subunit methyltransferase K/L n=1 Tax=Nannocystis pusilla TaxID=889268 RepID=A0ABS7TRP2_9BACT|nr:bifunctional 23S rRNA (guanine(2069)-N(7))-methyltransferase RlmK/23S rRNA (guanine(2445)-N(2))-methyltransferase RlmL [Nannocystis pusilla]